MGIFHGLIGNASEISTSEANETLRGTLLAGETVRKCFKLVRDMYAFTDLRLILVDKQGVTGKKIEYHSIPYKSITHFAVETAGHFDLDAELKIWLSGNSEPIQRQFRKGENIAEVQLFLAEAVLVQSKDARSSPVFVDERNDGQQRAAELPQYQPTRDVPLQESGPDKLFSQARELIASGQRDFAIATLRRLVEEYPDSAAAASAKKSLQKVEAV